MRKELLMLFVLFPLCFFGAGVEQRQTYRDSLLNREWWLRYSKIELPSMRDSSFIKWQNKREAKRVRFDYDFDFYTYFDNREYDAPYQIPQTIFNLCLSPEIGVLVKDPIGGKHRVMAGGRITYPLGGEIDESKIKLTAYYNYSFRGLSLSMGAIPYELRIQKLPAWLQYDSIAYLYPNIQGALFSYQNRLGYVSFMCDWRGSQSWSRREMFRVIIDGEFRYKWLTAGGSAQLNHTAMSIGFHDQESLFDDLNLSVSVGCNFSHLTVLDSLAFRLNYICGYNRDRTRNEKYKPQGFLFEFYLNWWFIGLKNTLYTGDNLQPHRPKIGSLMCQGDPFYQSTFYNRTDIFFYLYRSRFVNFLFSWNLHLDDHFTLQHQQQLCVRFNLNNLLTPKHATPRYLTFR